MLTLRDHDVADYVGLPDMDTTDVGVLDQDDWTCLNELGRYLVDNEASQRFGVWLLHKHFQPAPGEVFVERAFAGARKTETAPLARSDQHALEATSIRFDDGDEVVGMEFAPIGDFGDTAPLSDDDEAVLAGLAERLGAHGKRDRFGVRLIRNPLHLSSDEVLHETCDSARRTLQCHVAERAGLVDDHDTVQTAWRWKMADGEAGPVVMTECSVICRRVGEGHDIAHDAQDDARERD
jgi:hypothetical protein